MELCPIFDGAYTISVHPEDQVLVVSSIGYKTKEIAVNPTIRKTQTLNIKLREDVLGLDQVVVSATRGLFKSEKKHP